MSVGPRRAYGLTKVAFVAVAGPRMAGMMLALPRETRAVAKKNAEICIFVSFCVVFLKGIKEW